VIKNGSVIKFDIFTCDSGKLHDLNFGRKVENIEALILTLQLDETASKPHELFHNRF